MGGKMERGDAWPRPAHCSVHDGVVHIVVLTLRCDSGLLCCMAVGGGECWPAAGRCDCVFFSFCESAELFLLSVMGQADNVNNIKKDDNVAVLGLVARCVAAGVAGLGCFTDRRCSVAAWRTDRPAVRVRRPTALGLRDETAASVLWSQRHLLVAVGRCE
ncbi:putative retrotransposon hot spot protein (RHS) [Trypanosoma cruzi]|uniref:Putative retrotransposon hot spot protein (RHS) n=1 Tax=Trypanosoma cruzi TaxID=5693 RepID=A0A2V2X5G3_TRYCR|nr:putative retrotransposon hot spot protein (RHS) [Trypanosoma cruzi]